MHCGNLPSDQYDDRGDDSSQENKSPERAQSDDSPQIQPGAERIPSISVDGQGNVDVLGLPVLYVRASRYLVVLGMPREHHVRYWRRQRRRSVGNRARCGDSRSRFSSGQSHDVRIGDDGCRYRTRWPGARAQWRPRVGFGDDGRRCQGQFCNNQVIPK